MDVLTDTMSTTQMQSKTGYADSYDAMVEMNRKMERKLSDFKDFFAKGKAEKSLQAAVKAEDDAYDEEDASRRDASYNFYVGYRKGEASQAGYIMWKTGVMATTQMQSETRRDAFYNAVATQIAVKVMEASKAAVKAETRRVDSYDDVVEMMEDTAAASQAAIEVVKDTAAASQAVVKVMEVSKAAVKAETRRVDSYDNVVEMMEDTAAASQAAVKVMEATAAASKAANEAFFAGNKARKAFFARYKARKALSARYKASLAAFEAKAYDDEEDEDRAAEDFEAEASAVVASQVRLYIAALEVRGYYYDIY